MAETRTSFRLYHCPNCGGYGHNNMTIHLGVKGDCDIRKVEDFYVTREDAIPITTALAAEALAAEDLSNVRQLIELAERLAAIGGFPRSHVESLRRLIGDDDG